MLSPKAQICALLSSFSLKTVFFSSMSRMTVVVRSLCMTVLDSDKNASLNLKNIHQPAQQNL